MDGIKIKIKQKVFIVDDHPVIKEGLSIIINQEDGLNICGDAGDIPQALERIAETGPDVVIVDLALGKTSGLRLIEDLTVKYPVMPVLALSMHDESLYAERCLMAGAKGYIMKHEAPEKVISALKKVLGGEIYISDALSEKLMQKVVSGESYPPLSPLQILSNRELEVFLLIGQGIKTRIIAEQLDLSIKTIETHIDHIKKKMKLEDSRCLFLRAVQWVMSDTIN